MVSGPGKESVSDVPAWNTYLPETLPVAHPFLDIITVVWQEWGQLGL